jgi:hypothetical protein
MISAPKPEYLQATPRSLGLERRGLEGRARIELAGFVERYGEVGCHYVKYNEPRPWFQGRRIFRCTAVLPAISAPFQSHGQKKANKNGHKLGLVA